MYIDGNPICIQYILYHLIDNTVYLLIVNKSNSYGLSLKLFSATNYYYHVKLLKIIYEDK